MFYKSKQVGLIKLKKLLHSKGNYKQVKGQSSEWDKITVNETTNKGLISKVYKQLIQLNTGKTNNQIPINPNQKVGKRPKQTFLKRRHIDS